MSMNFKSLVYKSQKGRQLTYDHIITTFNQYIALFEGLSPTGDLEPIIKNAYAPEELRNVLNELNSTEVRQAIPKLQTADDIIKIDAVCRRLPNQLVSLNGFAVLLSQLVHRTKMVLDTLTSNVKKVLDIETTLNESTIEAKLIELKSNGQFTKANYDILRNCIETDILPYFHEQNIALPTNPQDYIEELLKNKIIMNCAELQEIANDGFKTYDTNVLASGMLKFINDIAEFFKNEYYKNTEIKPIELNSPNVKENIKENDSDCEYNISESQEPEKSKRRFSFSNKTDNKNRKETENLTYITATNFDCESNISGSKKPEKSKRRFSFSRKTDNKNRKEPENLKINDKSLVLKNKNSLANNTKPKISSPDSFKQDKVISILETLLSTPRLNNKFTKIIIKGAAWLANRGAKLQNPELQKKLNQLELTQELQKKNIINTSSYSSEETNDDDINKKTKKSKLDKLKKIFKRDKTGKNQNPENTEELIRELEKLIE